MGCQQMDFDKHSTVLSRTTFLHSRVPMHCVYVQRTDVSALVVPPLQSVTLAAGTTSTVATPVDMPSGMFYIDDIFTTLDMFIKQAQSDPLKDTLGTKKTDPPTTMLEIDEVALHTMMQASFDTKAFIRIPSSYSYSDLVLSRVAGQSHKEFFYSWSGFHLFIEPFIAAMENTLFRITQNTVAVTEDFQSYADAMTVFKRSIARGEVQLDMRRQRVMFDTEPDPRDKTGAKLKARSLNLGSRCLYSLPGRRPP